MEDKSSGSRKHTYMQDDGLCIWWLIFYSHWLWDVIASSTLISRLLQKRSIYFSDKDRPRERMKDVHNIILHLADDFFSMCSYDNMSLRAMHAGIRTTESAMWRNQQDFDRLRDRRFQLSAQRADFICQHARVYQVNMCHRLLSSWLGNGQDNRLAVLFGSTSIGSFRVMHTDDEKYQ